MGAPQPFLCMGQHQGQGPPYPQALCSGRADTGSPCDMQPGVVPLPTLPS